MQTNIKYIQLVLQYYTYIQLASQLYLLCEININIFSQFCHLLYRKCTHWETNSTCTVMVKATSMLYNLWYKKHLFTTVLRTVQFSVLTDALEDTTLSLRYKTYIQDVNMKHIWALKVYKHFYQQLTTVVRQKQHVPVVLYYHSGDTHTLPSGCRCLLGSGGFLLDSHSPPPDHRPTHSEGHGQTGNGMYGCSPEHCRRILDSFDRLELQDNIMIIIISPYQKLYIYRIANERWLNTSMI